MLQLLYRGLTWLCPCWIIKKPQKQNEQETAQIQMMAYPLVTRVSSRQDIHSPLQKQKYHTPNQSKSQIQTVSRLSKAQSHNGNISIRASDRLKQSEEFKSFKKTDSIIKKNFKIIGVSGRQSVNGLFESNVKQTFQNKEEHQQIIENYSSFVQVTETKNMKFRQSELMELQRLKKRLLIEIQTQIQEFEYFTSELDLIYENKQMNMVVELKREQETFETKTFCVLCKVVCPPISLVKLLKILNCIQCQSIFNSFKEIKAICKQPDLIIEAQKSNKSLVQPYKLNILKFLSLLEEDEDNKIYVVQVDTIINLQTLSNYSQDTYRKVTRIVRQSDSKLSIQIYTEESFSLKSNITPDSYYTQIYEKFSKYLLRKLKGL